MTGGPGGAEGLGRMEPRTLAAHIGVSFDAQCGPGGLVALGREFSSPTM